MNTLHTELKRALLSKMFLFSIIGFIVAILLGALDTMFLALQGGLVPSIGAEGAQIGYAAFQSEILWWVIPILSTLAYSASFTVPPKWRC